MTDTGGQQITVLIVDDHSVVRKGLRGFLDEHEDLLVVGEASDGAEAVNLACQLSPSIVLMDLLMPGMDGIKATQEICTRCPNTKVIALTSFFADEQVFPAIQAGASGYLLKDVMPSDLVRAIRTVHEGKADLHPDVAKKLVDRFRGEAKSPGVADLTTRELEVLQLVASGLTNQEIADRLVIGRKTVKAHVGNILSKLNLTDRTKAAIYAIRHGLVD